VNGKSGELLWTYKDEEAGEIDVMNLYTGQFVDDVDGDGVPDVVNIHGVDHGVPDVVNIHGGDHGVPDVVNIHGGDHGVPDVVNIHGGHHGVPDVVNIHGGDPFAQPGQFSYLLQRSMTTDYLTRRICYILVMILSSNSSLPPVALHIEWAKKLDHFKTLYNSCIW